MKNANYVAKWLAYLFAAMLIALMLSSCGVFKPAYKCTPSKGSRDYATITRIEREELVYWVKAQRYYNIYQAYFKCLPDSFKVGKKVNITNWERI